MDYETQYALTQQQIADQVFLEQEMRIERPGMSDLILSPLDELTERGRVEQTIALLKIIKSQLEDEEAYTLTEDLKSSISNLQQSIRRLTLHQVTLERNS